MPLRHLVRLALFCLAVVLFTLIAFPILAQNPDVPPAEVPKQVSKWALLIIPIAMKVISMFVPSGGRIMAIVDFLALNWLRNRNDPEIQNKPLLG